VQPEIEPGGSQLSGVLPLTSLWLSVTVPADTVGSKLMLTIPPPASALLPVTWLLFNTIVGVGWPAKKIAFVIPPPRPPGALFPDATVLFSVAVTWLRRPAPVAPGAVLPMIWLLLLTSAPPFEIPPPPASDFGRGVVADHALVEGDRTAGAAAVAVAAGDAAAARPGVVIDRAVVQRQAGGEPEDAAPAAARLRHRVPPHFALVQRGGRAKAVGDPPTGVGREVVGDHGAVQGQRAGEVQDAAAGTGRHHSGHVSAGDRDPVEGERSAGGAVDRDDRKFVELPAIVAFLPLIMIGVTTTGRPLPPITVLSRAVSEYVQPAARLIDPPPAALTVFIAATSPALSPQATLTDAAAPAAVAATKIAAAVHSPTTPRRLARPNIR
jgi:hypothetical protein